MGDAEIITSSWRNVELGRVVLITQGPYSDKLAAIVEIVDHKRVLIDNPTTKPNSSINVVPRHSIPIAHTSLTHIVIPNVPFSLGTGPLRKQWNAAGVDKTWSESVWAQTRARGDKRRQLSDFDRFKVMKLRKQARTEVRKSVAKARASAKA